ncbi:MAG: hypothetical protein JRH20_07700 [Deltaproteobacteria bacterium]|nr:hypothetical protein [Deltaproteobacteria bacterium]
METAGFDLLLWIAGGALAFKLFEHFSISTEERRWRRISQMSTTRLLDVPPGVLVKVRGTIRYAAPPLEAPISGRPCAYYDISVHHRVGRSWESLAHERRGNDGIWLEDISGSALIDLTWAHVLRRTVPDELLADGRLQGGGPRVKAYLESRDLHPGDVAAYSELILFEGLEVELVGTALREPDPAPRRPVGYRGIATRLRFCASRRKPVLLLVGIGEAKHNSLDPSA